MASKQKNISFGMDFQVNETGLRKIKKYLEDFNKLTAEDYARQQGKQFSEKTARELAELKRNANEISKIMQIAYNPKINAYNIIKFNQEIAKTRNGLKNFQDFQIKMSNSVEGRAFLNAQMNELTKFNVQVKESHKLLDSLGISLSNAIKWNISSSILNAVTQAISQAYGFAKNLDDTLNDIRIVSGKSADEMARFAERANAVASNLGKGTNDYTRAALIYAQQGLGDKEIEKRTEITLKTANVTGQSAEDVSQELTAVWNGYKVSAQQAELYIDRLAAVASTTASNLQELSTSMSKVASAAAALGVGEDQLAAQLSTIIAVTRQAPQTVGTALRTVYARITDIQAGMDEQGVTLGEYSGRMAEVGINVLDVNGKLRNMGEVMEEIGNKWSTLTKEQRIYLAQTMAGQRQYSNLTALFDNFDKYQSALSVAQNAQGRLSEQQAIYMDRLTTHVQQLTTATEHLWMNLIDTDGFKEVIDNFTTIIEKVDTLFKSLGGGKALIQSLIPLVGVITSKSIAKSINTSIINKQTLKQQKVAQEEAQRQAEEYTATIEKNDPAYSVWKRKSELLKKKNPGFYSKEQLQSINDIFNEQINLAKKTDQVQQKLVSKSGFVEAFYNGAYGESSNVFNLKEKRNEKGQVFYTPEISFQKKQEKDFNENIFENMGEKIQNIVNGVLRAQERFEDISGDNSSESLKKEFNENFEKSIAAIQEYRMGNKKRKEYSFEEIETNMTTAEKRSETKQKTIEKEIKKLEKGKNKAKKDNQYFSNFRSTFKGEKYPFKDDSSLSKFSQMIINIFDENGETINDILGQEKNFFYEKMLEIFKQDFTEELKNNDKKLRKFLNSSFFKKIYDQENKNKISFISFLTKHESVSPTKQIDNDIEKQKEQASNNKNNKKYQGLVKEAAKKLKENKEQFYINIDEEYEEIFKVFNLSDEQLKQIEKLNPETKKRLQSLVRKNKLLSNLTKNYNKNIDAEKFNENTISKKFKIEEKIRELALEMNEYFEDEMGDLPDAIQEYFRSKRDQQGQQKQDDAYLQQREKIKSRQNTIQFAMTGISALGQLSGIEESLWHIAQIWNDKNLSNWEKFDQTLSNIFINIGSLTPAFLQLKEAWSGMDKATQKTVGGYGIAIAALWALLEIEKGIANYEESRNKAIIENNNAIIEKEKEKQQQISHNKDIISEVEALNDQYEQGIISTSELKTKTEELQQKYKDESEDIRTLISDYRNLGQAAEQAKRKQLKAEEESLQKTSKAKETNFTVASKGKEYTRQGIFGLADTISIQNVIDRARNNTVFNTNWTNNEEAHKLGHLLQKAGLGYWNGTAVGLNNLDAKGTEQQVKFLRNYINNLDQTKLGDPGIKQIVQYLSEMQPLLQDWKNEQKKRIDVTSQQLAIANKEFFKDIDNLQDFNKAYIEAYNNAQERLSSEEGWDNLTKTEQEQKIKKAVENQLSSDLLSKYSIKEQILLPFGDSENVSNLIELIDKLDQNQLNEVLRLKDLIKDSKTLEDVLEEVFKHDYSLKINNTDLEEADEISEQVLAIWEKIDAGKKISNKDFKEIPSNILSDQDKEKYFRKTFGGHILKDQSKKEQLENKLLDNSYEAYRKDIEQIKSNIIKDDTIIKAINRESNKDVKQLKFQQDALYNEEDKEYFQYLKTRKIELNRQIKNLKKDYEDNSMMELSALSHYSTPLVPLVGAMQVAGLFNNPNDFMTKVTFPWKMLTPQSNQNIENIASKEQELKQLNQQIENIPKFQNNDINNANQINQDNATQMFNFLSLFKDDGTIQSTLKTITDTKGNLPKKIDQQKYETLYNLYISKLKEYKKLLEETEEKEKALEEAYLAYHDVIFQIDDDVDETIVAKLGEQFQLTAKQSKLLSEELENNAKKAKDVAEQVQRYNAALEQIITNYSEWKRILESGTTGEKLEIMPQLKDTMADVLGISEKTISNSFATTVENLENVKLALYGDKDAYKALQEAAYQDILINIKLNDKDIKNLNSYFQSLKLEEFEIGAKLVDDPNSNQDLQNQLNKLIEAGLDTEIELEAFFALKGIDLDVEYVDGILNVSNYTKGVTYELKQQEKEQEKLKQQERDRIKNQKELTEYLKDERDIYHEINRLLSDQERTIKRITRNQQDMYGTELLDNLNAESAEYKKQQKYLKSKQQLQKQDLANQRANLASKGAIFDANGNISNYNNLIGAATNNVNAIISRERGVQDAMNQYLLNGGNTSDEAYKNLEDQLSLVEKDKNKANDYLNDLKTNLSNYEKVKDQAEDVTDQLTELSEKQIEINLKKFNMKLEVTLDLSQATKTWNDYKRNVLQHDDIFNPNRALSAQKDNAQRLADINADSQSLNIVNKQIAEAMADNGTLYKTQGQKKKAIEELQKKAIQLRKGILENEDAIKQTYLEQYDIISEMFEKQKSQYDFVNNQLEHNKNMMSLVYGENNYAAQNVYNDKMIENNLKSIESMNNRVQIAEENLRKARESGDTAVIEKVEAEWQTAIQNRNQLEEQSAQLMKDRYTAAINQIAHQMEQKLTNNKGFNYMDTEWDLMKKQSNLYLDDVNSAFAVKNTEYLYNQALNDTKGLKSQQQLKKVMSEQLDILKEKDKLTQYDVDRAQKVLEVEKARIALEQARNNKTQMRLKRDSQGNYSYQYVADQDNIAKAENDLQKAENDLYNFDKDNYENKLKEAYDATKEYQEKITALGIEYATATEERRKQIDEEKRLLDQQYSEYILNLSQETEWGKQNLMESTMMNFTDMMNQEQLDFENMSDAQKAKWLEDMVPSINSGIAEMIGKFSTDPDSFKQIVVEATQAMDNERKTYQEGLANLQKAAGQNWNNIKQAMDPVVELQNELIEDNDRLKEQAGEIVEAMDGTLDALTTQADKWQAVYDKTDAAVLRVYDYIAAIDKAALKATGQDKKSEDVEETGNQTIPTVNNLETYGNVSPSNINSENKNNFIEDEPPSTKESNSSILSKGLIDLVNAGYLGSVHFDPHRSGELNSSGIRKVQEFVRDYKDNEGEYGYFTKIVRTKLKYLTDKDFQKKFTAVFNREYKTLLQFDTGGYTGDWSSSQGKLAVLHQKELVLNKEDTANMLEMIQMVREMQQQELQFRLSSLNNEIQDVMKQNAQVEKIQSKDELQQSVEMNVTFPNVNSKKEIEQALTELVNLAAQRALKYKKQ